MRDRNYGKGYTTLTSSTSEDGGSNVQVVSWSFQEAEKCAGSSIQCTYWNQLASQHYIRVRNIGTRTLFVRAVTKAQKEILCGKEETLVLPSFYHGYWDGCSLDIYFDDLSLIHICRCRRYAVCRSRWSAYH
eukprot:TRINITY_DN15483_c0_g1_i1.p2 TRINITY_DN15483_c0_g1~~TRINITY_DN15483_c0_g1_i1.p2  ORF type:complete len:132 (+),score=13.65 TRINITY_DN15483_c0_g1_i1:109-504(+)